MPISADALTRLRTTFDEIRETIGGADATRLAEAHEIAITDGGLLAFVDARSGNIGLPIQILEPVDLDSKESTRELLLREMLTHIAYILMREDYCASLPQYCDATGTPASIEWFSFQNITVLLAGVQRFLNMDLETQITLRMAIELLEEPAGSAQHYSDILREVQAAGCNEIPAIYVARMVALVQLSPTLFPDFTDLQLLEAARTRYEIREGRVLDDAPEIARWLLEQDEPTQDFHKRCWPEHISLAVRLSDSLRGINLRSNRPGDVLKLVSGLNSLDTIPRLIAIASRQANIASFASPLENCIEQLQRQVRMGVEILRPLTQLCMAMVCEHQGASGSIADRISILTSFEQQLQAAGCTRAQRAARGVCEHLEAERREVARRQADELRARGRNREQSKRALNRFMVRMSTARGDPETLRRVVKESLATQKDLSIADARAAIDGMIEKHVEQPEVAGKVMAELMKLASADEVSPAVERALARRYSFMDERPTSYDRISSTEILEILACLQHFEDMAVEVDHDQAMLRLAGLARHALGRERGLLKGIFKKDGGDATQDPAISARISRELLDLRRKIEAGKSGARPLLADAHFRMGLWSALSGRIASAVQNLTEMIKLTLDAETVAHLNAASFGQAQTRDAFEKSNAIFLEREEDLRRARAAGAFLEALACQADRAINEGEHPEIEDNTLCTILKVLETGKTLGDRAPIYKLLRKIPRIVNLGKKQIRLSALDAPGRGGTRAHMGLLAHYFTPGGFVLFLAPCVAEMLETGGQQVGRYVAELELDESIAADLTPIFDRLIPDLQELLLLERHSFSCQMLASTFLRRFQTFLDGRSPRDRALLLNPDAHIQEFKSAGRSFRVLFTRFVAEVDSSIPKSLFSDSADEQGQLLRVETAAFALEAAMTRLRREIARRLRRQRGITADSSDQAEIEDELRRIKAHSATLALLFMNVDAKMQTSQGSLAPLCMRRLFPAVLDPEFDRHRDDPCAPISTRAYKRIDVAWVHDRDSWLPNLEVGILYKTFINDSSDAIIGWCESAGFSQEHALAIKMLITRNCDRLLPDLQTLVRCGGAVYLSSNRIEPGGKKVFGSIVSSIDATGIRRASAPSSKTARKARTFKTTKLNTQRLRTRLSSLEGYDQAS